MQKLHLVGVTTARDALILSVRRGARSGSYLLPVDEALAEAVQEALERRDEPDAAAGDADEQPARAESALSVREIQARLRQGRSVADVAAAAGVEEAWVARFAPPILAERAQIVARALALPLHRPRLGDSAVPLGDAVRRHLAERGVQLTAQEYAEAWSAHQTGDGRWVVEVAFRSRGAPRRLRYDYDPAEATITTTDRTSAQAGYVAPDEPAPKRAKKAASSAGGARSTTKAGSRTAKERARAAAELERAASTRSAAARTRSRRAKPAGSGSASTPRRSGSASRSSAPAGPAAPSPSRRSGSGRAGPAGSGSASAPRRAGS
ncbi:MAG TPA: septation protein SepH, partial [Acidimicrobiales bacterium]|nr:septation protein SepH [Acidimicrobiales bacterium]